MNNELLKQIELLLGSVGVILGLFFSFILLLTKKKQPKYNLFLAIYLITFSLRIGKSIFHYFYNINASIRNFFITILFCVGPSVWLYSKYLVNKQEVMDEKDIRHFILFVILLPICWFIPNTGPGNTSISFWIFYNGIIIHIMFYCFYSFIWFMKNKKKPLINEENTINRWLQYFLCLNIIFSIAYLVLSKVSFPFFIGLSFLFSSIIVFLSLWGLKNPIVFKKFRKKYSLSNIDEAQTKRIMNTVKYHFEKEKPYLNPSLTLVLLSKQINISVKELSQSINQQEKLNYAQFVLKYRVDEAKRLLLSDAYKELTIASIAYDSGFNSISSFNTAFKKITNSTPLSFQRQYKKSENNLD